MGFFSNSSFPSGVTDISISFNDGVKFYDNNGSRFFYDLPYDVRSNYNHFFSIPQGTKDLSYFYAECGSYNAQTSIPSSVVNAQNMFQYCYNYNKATTLPSSLNNAYGMFTGCYNFSQAVTIPDSVSNAQYMFQYCENLNKKIKINVNKESFIDMNYMFAGCWNYDYDIEIPKNAYFYGVIGAYTHTDWETGEEYVYNKNVNIYSTHGSYSMIDGNYYSMFYYCQAFNGIVRFMDGTSPTNLSYGFYGCTKFNAPFTIPASATECGGLFSMCDRLNRSYSIPDNINASSMFSYCNNLNTFIRIPNNSNISQMFYRCNNYNIPTHVPMFKDCDTSYYSSQGLFSGCNSLNTSVDFDGGIKYLSATFDSCRNLNYRISLPSSLVEGIGVFSGCSNLNQNISIPLTLKNSSSMFYGCSNLDQNIKLPDGIRDISSMFNSCSNMKYNIQIPDSVNIINGTFGFCTNMTHNFTIGQNIRSFNGVVYGSNILNVDIQSKNYLASKLYSFSGYNFNNYTEGKAQIPADAFFEDRTDTINAAIVSSSIGTLRLKKDADLYTRGGYNYETDSYSPMTYDYKMSVRDYYLNMSNVATYMSQAGSIDAYLRGMKYGGFSQYVASQDGEIGESIVYAIIFKDYANSYRVADGVMGEHSYVDGYNYRYPVYSALRIVFN